MAVVKNKFKVEGMGCAMCKERVQNTLRDIKGVSKANVNLMFKNAKVEYDPEVVSAEDLKKAVKEAGYDLIIDSE